MSFLLCYYYVMYCYVTQVTGSSLFEREMTLAETITFCVFTYNQLPLLTVGLLAVALRGEVVGGRRAGSELTTDGSALRTDPSWSTRLVAILDAAVTMATVKSYSSWI